MSTEGSPVVIHTQLFLATIAFHLRGGSASSTTSEVVGSPVGSKVAQGKSSPNSAGAQ